MSEPILSEPTLREPIYETYLGVRFKFCNSNQPKPEKEDGVVTVWKTGLWYTDPCGLVADLGTVLHRDPKIEQLGYFLDTRAKYFLRELQPDGIHEATRLFQLLQFPDVPGIKLYAKNNWRSSYGNDIMPLDVTLRMLFFTPIYGIYTVCLLTGKACTLDTAQMRAYILHQLKDHSIRGNNYFEPLKGEEEIADSLLVLLVRFVESLQELLPKLLPELLSEYLGNVY